MQTKYPLKFHASQNSPLGGSGQIILWLNGKHYDVKDKTLILNNLGLYLQHLKAEKQNESIAHFASMLEDKKFDKVTAWVLVDSPVVMNVLEQFIGNIAL